MDHWTEEAPAVEAELDRLVEQRVALHAEAGGRSALGRLVRLPDGGLGFVLYRGPHLEPAEELVLEARSTGENLLLSCRVLAWSPGLPWRLAPPTVLHAFASRSHPYKGVTETVHLPLPVDPARRRDRRAA